MKMTVPKSGVSSGWPHHGLSLLYCGSHAMASGNMCFTHEVLPMPVAPSNAMILKSLRSPVCRASR